VEEVSNVEVFAALKSVAASLKRDKEREIRERCRF
jgi:hypothetical protein